MNLPWSKLANVTTDGSPNLTGKNVRLLKRIQDKVKEETPDQDIIFLHCIIHQKSLCKSLLKLNHVANTVVKVVNFIRARTSAPSVYFVLRGNRCRSPELTLPLSCPLVKFGQSVSTSVGAQRGDQRIFGVSGEI